MKKPPAQKIREYLRKRYGGKHMKEKNNKKGLLSDYDGAVFLDDIKRVKDGKEKKTKKNS